MLLVYALIGAVVLSGLSYIYAQIVEPRHVRLQKTGPKEYPDLWIEGLLDCEYSPTKQSYGPARIVPVGKINRIPISRGCEEC